MKAWLKRWWCSKAVMRHDLRAYQQQIASLVHENYQLRRGFDIAHARMKAAEQHNCNTERFLAVLQAEQVPDTELN